MIIWCTLSSCSQARIIFSDHRIETVRSVVLLLWNCHLKITLLIWFIRYSRELGGISLWYLLLIPSSPGAFFSFIILVSYEIPPKLFVINCNSSVFVSISSIQSTSSSSLCPERTVILKKTWCLLHPTFRGLETWRLSSLHIGFSNSTRFVDFRRFLHLSFTASISSWYHLDIFRKQYFFLRYYMLCSSFLIAFSFFNSVLVEIFGISCVILWRSGRQWPVTTSCYSSWLPYQPPSP